MDPAEELEMLKSESEAVKHDLETINRRINELEQKAAK
jgi:hypothetical protein